MFIHTPSFSRPAAKRTQLLARIVLTCLLMAMYLCPNTSASDAPGNTPGNAPGNTGLERANDQSIEQSTAEEMALAAQMLTNYPDDDEALLFQGRVHRGQGRSADAVKSWQQVLKVNPQHALAYHELAVLAKDKGEFEQAIDYWRRAVKLQPQWTNMRTRLGESLLEVNKPEQALTALQRGLPADPEFAPWHYMVAEGYSKLKEYTKAKGYYQKAIALSPQHTSSYYGLANACKRLGLKDEAKQHLDTFRRLKAADTEALQAEEPPSEQQRMIGRLARRLLEAAKVYESKDNLGRAEVAYKRAVEVLPRGRAPRQQLARLYMETQRLELALQQYQAISRNEPESIRPYMSIGSIHTQRQEQPQAKAAYEKVIELAPEQDLGYRHLARMYLVLNTHFDRARKLADKAVSIQPSAENYYYVAWACGATNDIDEAVRAMQEAVRLEPANQTYRQILSNLKRGPP